MRLASFISYVSMSDRNELWADMIYRNYDLTYMGGPTRLKQALRDCGYRYGEVSLSLAECTTRVREAGFNWTADAVRKALIDWQVWHRIKSGELRKWKYRRKN